MSAVVNTLAVEYELDIRKLALAHAVTVVDHYDVDGSPGVAVLRTAKKFEDYLLTGEVPEVDKTT